MRFYSNVTRIGNNICVREHTESGPHKYKIKYSPTLYISANKETEFRSLYGDIVKPVVSETMSEAREFVKKYSDVSGVQVYGQTDYPLAFINETYPGEIEFDIKRLSIWGLDIETFLPEDDNGKIAGFPDIKTANAAINLVTFQDFHSGQCYSFGVGAISKEIDTKYMDCGTEENLLKQILLFWNQKSVEVVTGWHIAGFDIPFLVARVYKVLGEEWVKKFSPWDVVDVNIKKVRGKELIKVDIAGVSVMDYLELYKKFSMTKQESYALGHIAQEELGTTKLDHSEFKNFNEFARKGWDLFVEYNTVDVKLIKMLETKLGMLNLAITICFMAKVNFENVYGPVRIWDTIIHNNLLKEHKVVPMKDLDGMDHESIEGAYVKDPIPGFKSWVVSVDAESLYPSNAIMLNMSPETYMGRTDCSIEHMLENRADAPAENMCMSPIGAMFNKEFQGIIPRLFEGLKIKRKEVKQEMLRLKQEQETLDKSDEIRRAWLVDRIATLDNKQQAFKILLNSAYGALGNKGFRFYNPNIAESITTLGQYALKLIEARLDARLASIFKLPETTKFVAYADTDSIYVEMESVVNKFMKDKPTATIVKSLEKIAVDIIQKEIDILMEEVCKNTNAYKRTLYFKLENVASKSLWVSKKKYIMRVHSSEGVTYAKPKYKVMGLDLVKSSTPHFVRDKLRESLDLIFDTDEATVQNYLKTVRDEFETLSVDQIAFPRGVNNLEKFSDSRTIYKKEQGLSVPIHVRASLLYNNYLHEMGLIGIYSEITSGSKIKFVYLKMPNKIKENIIAMPADEKLPDEFDLDKIVDRDTQWEKSMVASMQNILTAINWSAVPIATLDVFY